MTRPAIPNPTKRRVLIESGYRCAVPTCRTPIYENAHIESWAESKDHSFGNLICLCPNCHTRYDKGEISKEAIKHYKRKLSFLNDLYTKFEIDTLDSLKIKNRAVLPSKLLIKRLLDEKLVRIEDVFGYQSFGDNEGEPFLFSVVLTEKGRELINDWIEADKFQTSN